MRIWVLLFALFGLTLFQFGQGSRAAIPAESAPILAKGPGARSILVLGNSRTFYNDMPGMLRKIADSAQIPAKFRIVSHAKANYTMKDHWSDKRTRRLLRDTWHEIIIQGESGAQASPEQGESFKHFGAKLASLAQRHTGRPTLVVAWPYDASLFADYPSYNRARHLRFLEAVHADLAGSADLERVNLAGLWESVTRSHPEIKLTSDGNHPTVAGTYLYSLALYRHLTQSSVGEVTFSPNGLSAGHAKALRAAVDSFPTLSS